MGLLRSLTPRARAPRIHGLLVRGLVWWSGPDRLSFPAVECGGGQPIEALVRNCHSCSCAVPFQRENTTQTRDQEDQAENSVVFLLLTSFRATPVLRGHLGRGDKELTFSKGKRGERQMDRGRGRGETDGWRGKGEVREKAVFLCRS